MDAIAGTQLPMPHAVNAAGDAAGPAPARPNIQSKDRKAAARRTKGVPADFIVPSVFWVRDATMGLWLEYKFEANQLVAEWRDISKMVATGKKLSDNEMCDGKMYSAPNTSLAPAQLPLCRTSTRGPPTSSSPDRQSSTRRPLRPPTTSSSWNGC